MERNENGKTLREKLWDKGKYLIPLYGGMKAAQEGKGLMSTINMLYSVFLSAGLILYTYAGINYKTFNPKEIRVAMTQEAKRETYERKDLRHQLYLVIDNDKNGTVDEQEFLRFCNRFVINGLTTTNLKRIVESYEAQ